MEFTDDELKVIAKALASFTNYLQAENELLLNTQQQLPDAVYLAAHNILQEHLAPVTELQIKLSKHFGMPNMPTG